MGILVEPGRRRHQITAVGEQRATARSWSYVQLTDEDMKMFKTTLRTLQLRTRPSHKPNVVTKLAAALKVYSDAYDFGGGHDLDTDPGILSPAQAIQST